MNRTATDWADRLRRLRRHLNVDQDEMGRRLGVSREWVSKLEREREEMSELVQRRLSDLEQAHGFTSSEPRFTSHHLKSGGSVHRANEPRAALSGEVASRLPQKREPSTRADCEQYFQQLMDAADLSDDPNAFPVILHRLKKSFPLDEWENETPPST